MDREELAEALAGIVAQSWEDPTGYISPNCNKCKHLIPESARCKAFPHGIPRAILANRADHTKPYPGDNGIRFEKKG